MAKMYPNNLAAYKPNESERKVYNALRDQLPDSFEVFYSFSWSYKDDYGSMRKSECDFIVTSPEYGYLCIEVKGGSDMQIDVNNRVWHLVDSYGGHDLNRSPYEQVEENMYFLKKTFRNRMGADFPGIYASCVMFPFYKLPNSPLISDRNEECTIDKIDMGNLKKKIIQIFNVWGRDSYRARAFNRTFYDAFIEMIKKKIAVAAAAGALIELKKSQLDIVNRVQDNYMYFLSNIRQFYIRGGAGTGKTWLAMKLANDEAKYGKDVLLACASKPLASMIRDNVVDQVEVYDIEALFNLISNNEYNLQAPLFEGIEDNIRADCRKYDSIFIDEAQDFTPEWAYVIRLLLKNDKESRLGVFYDDVQILREESFADAFMIDIPPFLLRENIRNTSSIYDWTTERTNLGMDVISNPVEGPKPKVEYMRGYRQLTNRLQNLFKEYLVDEDVMASSMTVLVDDVTEFMDKYKDGIAKWTFVEQRTNKYGEIFVSGIGDFKGLESDMVIYIHKEDISANLNYIAYTRAKYYLIELILR